MERKKTHIKVPQKWTPYWEWEDYHAGMWRTLPKHLEATYTEIAVNFTGDHLLYGEAMREVIFKWPRTMINSLTNPSINKRAFLGHCAVQYKINIPEYITRMAWRQLTDKQRVLADEQAEKNINLWLKYYERKNKSIHSTLGEQMLSLWNSG